jgi:hypothetical protein
MAQLRLGYPDIQRRGAEVLQITHNTRAEAERYFKHYPIVFPYLCDPDRTVHERYGLQLMPGQLGDVVGSFTTTVSDFVRLGERTASPASFVKRYGWKDSPQAVVVVDRDGIVRHVVRAEPNAQLPSNAEIFRRLDAIR